MRKIILFNLLFLFLLSDFYAQEIDSPKRKSLKHQQGFLLYAEIGGHNFYSFEEKNETDFLCVNTGYRHAIIKGELYAMVSVGYGTFKETHVSRPREYSNDRVHYVPLELAVQIGGGPHYFEFGYSVTPGLGTQELYYGVRQADTIIRISNAIQHIPRIGYSYFGKDGLVIRLSYTHHFYSRVSESIYSMSLDHPRWLPLGVSIGYLF